MYHKTAHISSKMNKVKPKGDKGRRVVNGGNIPGVSQGLREDNIAVTHGLRPNNSNVGRSKLFTSVSAITAALFTPSRERVSSFNDLNDENNEACNTMDSKSSDMIVDSSKGRIHFPRSTSYQGRKYLPSNENTSVENTNKYDAATKCLTSSKYALNDHQEVNASGFDCEIAGNIMNANANKRDEGTHDTKLQRPIALSVFQAEPTHDTSESTYDTTLPGEISDSCKNGNSDKVVKENGHPTVIDNDNDSAIKVINLVVLPANFEKPCIKKTSKLFRLRELLLGCFGRSSEELNDGATQEKETAEQVVREIRGYAINLKIGASENVKEKKSNGIRRFWNLAIKK